MMELKTIIGKNVLLEKLRSNKLRYIETRKTLIEVYKKKDEEYQEAYRAYSKKVVDSTLAEKEDKPYPPIIPEDRTKTYDMYIAMVDLHCDRTLEIDSGNFNKLYMDKWDFIKQHIAAMTVWADSAEELAPALLAYGGEG
ncbi:unnamed protein product [marine sediment metagenome]|uniref:Uncharacterized protein n=1 Tax=marine sediment metagenome TaxID=412755 RepID=X1BH64_9ZZZZ